MQMDQPNANGDVPWPRAAWPPWYLLDALHTMVFHVASFNAGGACAVMALGTLAALARLPVPTQLLVLRLALRRRTYFPELALLHARPVVYLAERLRRLNGEGHAPLDQDLLVRPSASRVAAATAAAFIRDNAALSWLNSAPLPASAMEEAVDENDEDGSSALMQWLGPLMLLDPAFDGARPLKTRADALRAAIAPAIAAGVLESIPTAGAGSDLNQDPRLLRRVLDDTCTIPFLRAVAGASSDASPRRDFGTRRPRDTDADGTNPALQARDTRQSLLEAAVNAFPAACSRDDAKAFSAWEAVAGSAVYRVSSSFAEALHAATEAFQLVLGDAMPDDLPQGQDEAQTADANAPGMAARAGPPGQENPPIVPPEVIFTLVGMTEKRLCRVQLNHYPVQRTLALFHSPHAAALMAEAAWAQQRLHVLAAVSTEAALKEAPHVRAELDALATLVAQRIDEARDAVLLHTQAADDKGVHAMLAEFRPTHSALRYSFDSGVRSRIARYDFAKPTEPEYALDPPTATTPHMQAAPLHLARYLPQWAWMRCAEGLVSALERRHLYAEATRWLTVLLVEPITIARGVTVPFAPRRRGGWHQRLVLDLAHSANEDAALAHAECCLGLVREASFIAPVSGTMPGAAMVDVTAPSTARAREAALQRLTYDTVQEFQWMRRFDRFSLERTLRRLQAPPRRWVAHPEKFLLTSQLRQPQELTIHVRRVTNESSRFRSSTWGNGHSVERAALEYLIDTAVSPAKLLSGVWQGAHCEGRWFETVFNCVFRAALRAPFPRDPHAPPSRFWLDHVRRDERALTGVILTPFDSGPRDKRELGFYHRRHALIEAALIALRGMTPAELAQELRTYGVWLSLESADVAAHAMGAMNTTKNIALLLDAVVRQQAGLDIRSSGFPDLALWYTSADTRRQSGAQSAKRTISLGTQSFVMVEVKGPNDSLSPKQHVINDLLLRCGFEVRVCYVRDAKDAGKL